MVSHTLTELENALKDFDTNYMCLENVDFHSYCVAVDCIRSCILQLRKNTTITEGNKLYDDIETADWNDGVEAPPPLPDETLPVIM